MSYLSDPLKEIGRQMLVNEAGMSNDDAMLFIKELDKNFVQAIKATEVISPARAPFDWQPIKDVFSYFNTSIHDHCVASSILLGLMLSWFFIWLGPIFVEKTVTVTGLMYVATALVLSFGIPMTIFRDDYDF